MPSIEESVRTMLTSYSQLNDIPNDRITFGYRLQSTALPAITYMLQQAEFATLDGDRRIVDAEFSYICATALEAAEREPDMRAAVRTGTFTTNKISAVVWTGSRVEEPVTADGDEQQPAVLVCTATLYFELL